MEQREHRINVSIPVEVLKMLDRLRFKRQEKTVKEVSRPGLIREAVEQWVNSELKRHEMD